MTARSYKPDDPEFAAFIAANVNRPTAEPGAILRRNFDPRFGQYIAGELDKPTEKIMAEITRATEDEVVNLPDGRQIQIQAKGAPVDEKLAKRERELLERSIEREKDADPLREIQPEAGTRAIGTRALTDSGTTDTSAALSGGRAATPVRADTTVAAGDAPKKTGK
jgi:hypothetical protein